MQIFEHNGGQISYLNTPWDAKVLGCETISISEISSPTQDYATIVPKFMEFCNQQQIGFISTRISASNPSLHSTLQSNGFKVVEHTLDVHTSALDLSKIQHLIQRFPIQTSEHIGDHIPEVKQIAEEAFHFGRFHEDPDIRNELAALRNSNWIDDLIQKKAPFNLLLKKGRAVGFLSWDRAEENNVTLQFGGVLERYQHLAYAFWAHTLIKLQPFASLSTTISSSNTPIINLYSYFGFSFTHPQIGLTWHAS